MLDECDAAACRKCGRRPKVVEVRMLKTRYLACPGCGMRTPAFATADQCVRLWNEAMGDGDKA